LSANHWVAVAGTELAAWDVDAPDRLALADAILRAGADTNVFRVAVQPIHGGVAQPFDYLAHLRGGARAFELSADEAPQGYRFVTPGRVCWHGRVGVEQDDVADLGALMSRLRPRAEEWTERFMAHVAPVEVWRSPYAIRFALATDIWFPQVLGVLDGDAPPPPAPPQRDNRALAACHTPRLNAFLADVRAAAERLGGTWRLVEPEGIGVRYAAMTGETGIRL
jgi:hypothetical protein